jgi:hypothetical protein
MMGRRSAPKGSADRSMSRLEGGPPGRQFQILNDAVCDFVAFSWLPSSFFVGG